MASTGWGCFESLMALAWLGKFVLKNPAIGDMAGQSIRRIRHSYLSLTYNDWNVFLSVLNIFVRICHRPASNFANSLLHHSNEMEI